MAQGEHLVHTANREHIREERNGHAGEIVGKVLQNVVQYLKEHPANYQGQVDTLLELLYQAFTEYNSVETPEFKKGIHPLREKLRSLVDTEQDVDDYMDIVFSMCAAYERQGYIEGIKVGARLMMELLQDG